MLLPVPWGSLYRAELWEIYALLIKQRTVTADRCTC